MVLKGPHEGKLKDDTLTSVHHANSMTSQVSYGGYKLGANSANILVQDRRTGMINEERMSVYVRLGIRLLYKGLKSREMEKKRGMQCFLPSILTRISRLSTSSESYILRSSLPVSLVPSVVNRFHATRWNC